MGTSEDRQDGAGPCQAREVFDRVGDKWSVSVIHQLGAGTMRFTDLRQTIDGISQRMLTVTLRGLERDGIVTRTVHPVIPPRVDYALTPMGCTLLDMVGALVAWAHEHLGDIGEARGAYDRRVLDYAILTADEPCADPIGSEERQDDVGR